MSDLVKPDMAQLRGGIFRRWRLLKQQAPALVAIEPRAADVLWPLFNYQRCDIRIFDMATMCLLADDDRHELLLNERILTDIGQHLGPATATGADWFWLHQLVHISQGLSYASFRDLNKDTDRMETMRADCWADFISIKVLVLSQLLDEGKAVDPDAVLRRTATLLTDIVRPMIAMNPNIFIPFEREIEIKRVVSLLAYCALIHRAAAGNAAALNDSLFVNWRTGSGNLYPWYGQTSLLGRRAVKTSASTISTLVDAIKKRKCEEAYMIVESLDLPAVADVQGQLLNRYPWCDAQHGTPTVDT